MYLADLSPWRRLSHNVLTVRTIRGHIKKFIWKQEVAGVQKLLLLEDDTGLIDGLTYSLEKSGFEVEAARAIKEAEEKLIRCKEYALLLFDVTLPDGSGFGLCGKLRAAGDSCGGGIAFSDKRLSNREVKGAAH